MNFSAWAIRNPVAPLLAFVMLLMLGYQSFYALPITRFPNIDVPLVSVVATEPGAAPAEMETQVTKVIEDAVSGIAGVKDVQSSIGDGSSSTVIQFRMEIPTDKAVQDVKDAIDRIVTDLPADVEAPSVTRIDVEGQAIQTFAVTSPNMNFEELSYFVDDTIKRGLQGKPGVGKVERYGGADREIRIELDPVKLGSFGVTAQAVSQQLKITNTNQGGGRADFGTGEQAIRTMGDAATVAKLAATPIALPSGRYAVLSDLGTVTDTSEELRSFSRLGDQRVVTFAVFRSKGASEVSVAETISAELAKMRTAHPEVDIKMVDDSVYFTYGNYEAAIHTLLEGALLAVFVVMIFLRNWRATLISAIALPLSAIPTFWVMNMLGFSLNLVSFLSLTLATGILVDDAIVEIENIARHIRMGKTPFKASIDAADEIGLAVIATTSTIIAVFVPVSFMPGIPGQYFRQFGITVAVSVAFSLLVARLITPMLAAYFMKASDGGTEEDHRDGWIGRAYLALIRASTKTALAFNSPWRNAKWVQRLPDRLHLVWRYKLSPIGLLMLAVLALGAFDVMPLPAFLTGGTLVLAWVAALAISPLGVFLQQVVEEIGIALIKAHRYGLPNYYFVLAGALVAVFFSVQLMSTLPNSFIPPDDTGRVTVSVELPPGSTLDETDKTTQAIYDKIKDIPNIDKIFILGGSSPTGTLDVRLATVTVILNKLDHRLILKLSQVAHGIPLIGPWLPLVKDQGRPVPQNLIEAEIFKRLASIPDIRAQKLDDRGSRPLTFNVLADNEADLDGAVAMLLNATRGEPTLADVSADGALPRPEVQITPRADEAARLGVTAQQIAAAVRVATIGDYDAALAKVSIDNRLIPIRVRLNDASRENVNRIGALQVQTNTGIMVPLATVADIRVGEGPSSIKRYNRQKLAVIGANLPVGVALGTATDRFNEIAATLTLPGTARFQESGDAEVQAEMTASFGNAMLMGLMLMLSVLILLFRSAIQPFTILFSLPLSIGGVATALLVTNSAVSMPVYIGLLMLMGIVAKNAILLIDFAIEMRARGMARAAAVVEAGHKRARPIVMTSIAMSAGMLPSALGVGEGGAFRAPMATAVIGGIIVSTVLSLVIVPSFYMIMDDLSALLGRIFGRLVAEKEVEVADTSSEVLAERIALLAAEQAGLREKVADLSTPMMLDHRGLAAE
ncbi:MAG: efflux RND transporter permease subunit [Cypionkella sp.]